MRFRTVAAAAAAMLMMGQVASAQKAKDTLRIPYIESTQAWGNVFNAQLEGNFIHQDVYEALLAFDEDTKKIVGQLAESWKRVDDSTFEFTLRHGIKYSNGNSFDADDAVFFINFISNPNDPETKRIMHGQRRYDWLKGAEKLGPDRIRIKLAKPGPIDELKLAMLVPMYDSETMKQQQHYSEYESTVIGTGPYKVTQIDPSKGISAVRNPDFQEMPGRRHKASIGTVKMLFMPDIDTEAASLLVGDVDVVKNLQIDQVKNLVGRGYQASPRSEETMLTLEFDSVGRSAQKALKDPRVRKAIEMAIDRKVVMSVSPAGNYGELMDEICFKTMIGCPENPHPQAPYDPAGAKKLLAEAGYPNGFDMVLTSRSQLNDPATAVSGMLRNVGINAPVDLLARNVMQKRRADGQITAHLTSRPLFEISDVSAVLDNYFYNTSRDYWQDQTINALGEEGMVTMDPKKRDEVYKKIFDRVNDEAYVFSMSSLPVIFIHGKDLKISEKHYLKPLPSAGDFSWQ